MNEINFLHRDEDEVKRAKKLKLIVMPITTAILVVFLVLISGLGGWWWWWSMKQNKVSADYASLISQVNSQQEVEVLSRRLYDRKGIVNDYLNRRIDIYGQTDFLESDRFTTVAFNLKGGYFSVTVQATDSAEIAALANLLSDRYRDVEAKSLGWSTVEGVGIWTGEFLFRVKKGTL